MLEKEYIPFILDRCVFQSGSKTIRLKDELLTFEGMDFNSGLLSFDREYINCSIGSSKWERTIILDNPDGESQSIAMNEIKKFKFIDCKFSDDTYFKKDLDHLEFIDCIFEKAAELSDFTIKKFNCENIDFKSYVAIDEVIFSEKVIFKYVSFMGYLYIRNSTFSCGLDLDNANLEKEITFFNNNGLDSSESVKNTSQETYRIIKYQLEKVGNIIASNKYHALELEKYRKNSWNNIKENFLNCRFFTSELLDGIVSLFHWLSSNHSRDWFLTLIWIFVVGAGTSCIVHDQVTIEYTFQYLSIININDEDLKKHSIVAVLNKVLLGYLYYQFLTAIRKNTRNK